MKILVLTCMFPCKRHPTSAIFFANLMKELALIVDELIIITPRVYIPKCMTKINKKWSKWYLDSMSSKENGMRIIRPHFLCFRGVTFNGINGVLMQYSLQNSFKNLVKTKKIDMILGYNLLPEGIAASRLAKMLNLPVGFWVIGTDLNDFAKYNRVNHYFSKKCMENSDIIFSESKELENKIKKFSTKTLNVKTFYKGIDISNFQNLPSRNKLFQVLNINPDKKYILFAGRLVIGKGIYELAQAFKYISKKNPSFNLILVGEEIEKEKIQTKFNEDGLLERVHFQGIKSHKEVAYFMKISDLLVLPTWAEGLPNVVIEAMSIGLPVVSTNVGGIPEILENGVTGLSVPVKNVEKLTEAVNKMLEDIDLREKCIRNAKELVLKKFDVKKNVFELYGLLQEVIIKHHKN